MALTPAQLQVMLDGRLVRDFREFSGTTRTEFLRAGGPDGDSMVSEPQIDAGPQIHTD
jgi:hypothetical protein